MSDLVADVFAEWGIVPEDVVSLPVSPFSGRGWFVIPLRSLLDYLEPIECLF